MDPDASQSELIADAIKWMEDFSREVREKLRPKFLFPSPLEQQGVLEPAIGVVQAHATEEAAIAIRSNSLVSRNSSIGPVHVMNSTRATVHRSDLEVPTVGNVIPALSTDVFASTGKSTPMAAHSALRISPDNDPTTATTPAIIVNPMNSGAATVHAMNSGRGTVHTADLVAAPDPDATEETALVVSTCMDAPVALTITPAFPDVDINTVINTANSFVSAIPKANRSVLGADLFSGDPYMEIEMEEPHTAADLTIIVDLSTKGDNC